MKINNNIGSVIKHIRKSKGLTQTDLSGEGSNYRICSVRHLRKIESSQILPNATMLNQLLAALGVSLPEFTLMLFGEQMIYFNNEMEAIRNLFFEEEYAQAEERFEKLREHELFDTRNPLIMQSTLLYEGMILKYIHRQPQQSLEKLYTALRITSNIIIKSGRDELDFNYIANNPLTLTEYRILMMISNVEEERGNTFGQIEILTATCESLENTKMDDETKNKLLPAIYFNLSNALLVQGNYRKALHVSEKGIALCQEAKVFRAFSKLLWNKGRALYHLDNKSGATKYFQKSHDCFMLHGSIENAEYLRITAADKYGILIGSEENLGS